MRPAHLAIVALLVAAPLLGGCGGPSLWHAGYAAPNKVWYHWVQGSRHTMVVCDVAPDGAESNCKESEI